MTTDRSSMKSAYAGIFLLAGSIILFEIALTRVFAIMMWHHFTYMVVSIAMLGFGAAGSLLTARGDSLKTESPVRGVTLATAAYGLAVMLAFCFVTLVRIDSLVIHEEPSNIVALLLIYAIIVGPFLLAGIAIGLALTRWSEHVNRLYFADLVGSAVGGGASVLLLATLGNVPTIMVAAAAGCVAALLFGLGAPKRYLLATLPAAVIGVAVAFGFITGRLEWEIPFAPGKELATASGQEGPTEFETALPSATAEVEISPSFRSNPMIGGNFGAVDTMKVEVRYVAQDGTAPTMMYRNASDLSQFPFLDDTQAASAYVAMKARGGSKPEVLVIGVGGGVDVMCALFHDAAKVTAVEINSAMIRMVTETYADYMGGFFTGGHALSDRIDLINMEGRSYMRSRDDRYDVIQMNGVDSFTALSTGAYTLSESYLYTVDAVREFYRHLNDDGYINYSRFVLNHPKKPRETLRLANIAREALAQEGVEDPASHILVFQGKEWASTMIKRGPFTRAEVAALERFGRMQRVFKGMLFDPLHERGAPFGPPADLLDEVEKASAASIARLVGGNVTEAELPALQARVADAFAASFREDAAETDRIIKEIASRRGTPAGVGDTLRGVISGGARVMRERAEPFLRTRRDFETVLRGTSRERADFVAAYEYDVSPCTDDAPFFFNYYRYGALLDRWGDGEKSETIDRYHPDFPVGHMVLLASLAQIALLAVIMIFLPLRSLKKAGVSTPGAARYLAYFTALGVGFMFVEIVLMQKMVIFLGHPTYALSIVLTSILGFAGLGSFLAGRIQRLSRGVLLKLMVATAGLILLESLAANHLLPLLLGQALWFRITLVILLLAPLGLVLGMPFPSGIRILKAQCPQLLPWGWAINGFCSVLASVLCIVLSMWLGFTNVLYIAAGIYVLGFLLMKPEPKPAVEAEVPAEEMEVAGTV